ncbi:MAG: hypothetical protein ABI955_02415, partial [Nitrospirota bacterium]
RLMARMVALVYNWWTLFVRLAHPHKHFEAITSRPLLLHGVATHTRHAGQTRLTITRTHAKQAAIQAVLTNLAGFLRTLKTTAEQWTDGQRLRAILERAFAKFMCPIVEPPTHLALHVAKYDGSTAFFRIIGLCLMTPLRRRPSPDSC